MATPTTKKKTRKRNALPKPPLKTRVAIKAPPLRDAEGTATYANKLVSAAEANTGMFVSPPYVPLLKSAAGVLSAAIVPAEGGTDAAQAALLTATVKVHDLIVQHAGWVQAGANNLVPADAVTFITTAGFQVAKRPQRIVLTSPKLSNTTPTVIHFELPKLPGAIMWFSEVSTDGGKTFVDAVDTELRNGDITGLTSGQIVSVRLRAYVRGSGYTPWISQSIVVT